MAIMNDMEEAELIYGVAYCLEFHLKHLKKRDISKVRRPRKMASCPASKLLIHVYPEYGVCLENEPRAA